MIETVRAVLFDLDGTLLNTLSDISHAMNTVLERHGMPVHETDAYRRMVGSGLEVLVERAVPDRASDDRELIRALADEWLAEYARDPVARTRPYDGIEELVDRLRELGLVLGVLSNKPDGLVRRSVAALFNASAFAVVWGKRDEMPAKPDPTSAAAIAAEIDVAPGEIVYLGDSDIDVETARNAGMIPVGAAWGFRGAEELRAAGAEHVISEPAELIDLVTKESEVWRQR